MIKAGDQRSGSSRRLFVVFATLASVVALSAAAAQADPGAGADTDATDRTFSSGPDSFLYSTLLDIFAPDVAVDPAGSAYVSGFISNGATREDVVVLKLSPDGTEVDWVAVFGGSRVDQPTGIAVDPSGAVYLTGFTNSHDLPVTPGAFDTSTASDDRASGFVTKLAPGGQAIEYSTYLGGDEPSPQSEMGRDIAVDGDGAAYVSGTTSSADFPTTASAFQPAIGGNVDGFVTKFTPDGGSLEYSTFLGGTAIYGGDLVVHESAESIAIDEEGSAYVAGLTNSGDFPTSPGAPDGQLTGVSEAFATKLAPDGGSLDYSTYLGGNELPPPGSDLVRTNEYAHGVAVDGSGAAYVAGQTAAGDFPVTPGAADPARSGPVDGFVTKISADGQELGFSTYLGGSYGGGIAEYGEAVATDSSGNAFVTGYTHSADFPITPGAPQPTLGGGPTGEDAFVTEFGSDGTILSSTFLGGTHVEDPRGIAVDPEGNAYATGLTRGIPSGPGFVTDFPLTPGAYDTSPGFNSGYLTKLGEPSTSTPPPTPGPSTGIPSGSENPDNTAKKKKCKRLRSKRARKKCNKRKRSG
jgi:hypothetical protein